MIGTLVNATTIIIGGSIGIAFKRRLPQKTIDLVFQGLGLVTLCIGISMFLDNSSLIVVVLSVLAGCVTGMTLRVGERIDKASARLKRRFSSNSENFTEGLITAFLLYCIGAMTIMGSINEGLGKGPEILITKAIIDGFAAIAMASALGVGVLFSSIPLILFQGSITLLAFVFGDLFNEAIINDLSATGGVLLAGIGFNLLRLLKIEVSNMLPAILYAILFSYINTLLTAAV